MTKPSSHLVSILNYSTFEDRSQKGIGIYGYCEQQRVMNSAAATFPEVRYHLILIPSHPIVFIFRFNYKTLYLYCILIYIYQK